MSGFRSAIIAPLMRAPVLTGAALLALSAWIVVNALLLQPRPHPTPYVQTREPAAADVRVPNEITREVQDALKQIGYYSGPLDGIAGPQTRSAILSFEASAGRDTRGEATRDLLVAIRSANRPDRSSTALQSAQSEPPPATPDPLAAAVQRALARAAYGPIGDDGVVGPETQEAIKRFQRDHNLPVTGEISDTLMVELRAVGAIDGDP